nr:TauD/TfdA family dioxygenase [Chitinophaga varians]
MPLIFTWQRSGAEFLQWINHYSEYVKEHLAQHGALLIRGTGLSSVEEFNSSFITLYSRSLEYNFRTSPRKELGDRIYTSTVHPADQLIHMHTENSYAPVWNQIIAFFCQVPALTGGETPLADERAVVSRIDPSILEKFRRKGILYVRNAIPGVGLSWQEIYQTTDRKKVERYLNENGITYSWESAEHLRTSWALPAFRIHPDKKEEVWFNHMYFGHKGLYDPDVLEYFGEDQLPFVTNYGDGEPIEEEVLSQFTDAYNQCKVVFQWEKGDLLLLDNMVYSHGRNPYTGDRSILVAMARRTDGNA